MPSDAERLRRALAAIRWGPAALADALGIRQDSARKWLQERLAVPPSILAWAERLAAFHRANPPPLAPPPAPRADPQNAGRDESAL